MKKILYFTKLKIQKELKHITYNDIINGSEWLDKDTWICWGILWKPHLYKLRKLLDKIYELPKDINADEGKIMIEYHEDDKTFWYGLFFDDETINITSLFSTKYLNNLIINIKNEKGCF